MEQPEWRYTAVRHRGRRLQARSRGNLDPGSFDIYLPLLPPQGLVAFSPNVRWHQEYAGYSRYVSDETDPIG